MADIALRGLHKSYRNIFAIRDLSLDIRDGEFLVLLGPSGCGKTTTLRAIAGLEVLDRGSVIIGGRDVTTRPPGKRGIAMVFQSYAVFPHMRVYDNIVFGLRMRGISPEEQRRRADEAVELLEIAALLDRFPAQLSGGQRQRVAVARAIVMRPDVLLMDEPLSNLDALLRLHMRAELKRLHRELKGTTVYVTHDQVEALSLGDRIAVMKDGEIVQCSTPGAIYDTPANRFVGSFIGSPPMNFIPARLRRVNGRAVLEIHGRSIAMDGAEAEEGMSAREDVLVGIRPEHIDVAHDPTSGALAARVIVLEPIGPQNLLTVDLGGEPVKVAAAPDFHADAGGQVWLRLDPHRIRLMDAQTGASLAAPRP